MELKIGAYETVLAKPTAEYIPNYNPVICVNNHANHVMHMS